MSKLIIEFEEGEAIYQFNPQGNIFWNNIENKPVKFISIIGKE